MGITIVWMDLGDRWEVLEDGILVQIVYKADRTRKGVR